MWWKAILTRFLLLFRLERFLQDNADDLALARGQIAWLRSKGGFFDSRLAIQRSRNNDPSSSRGIYATADIDKGEMLIIVPRDTVLDPRRRPGNSSTRACDTARMLMEEYKLGNGSAFEPYVNYLFSLKQDIIPSAWSREGKAILHDIFGSQLLRVTGLTNLSYKRLCGGSGNPIEEAAFSLVVARSFDGAMLPVYDMTNHRRGHWENVDTNSAFRERDLYVYATRKISSGEQLYFSYTDCTNCPVVNKDFVVQDMMQLFGFVEEYPQRWKFFVGKTLLFDLDMNNDLVSSTHSDPGLHVIWHSDRPNIRHKNRMINYMKRLQDMGSNVSERVKNLESRHERNAILEFYESLKTALEYAIWYGDETSKLQDTCGAYDDLIETLDPLNYDAARCSGEKTGFRYILKTYHHVDEVQSQYQKIDFYHHTKTGDMCLALNRWLQACASFRPHYHEVFVHYPARFTRQMKRVIYLGGGDNMILHEIIKHKSLELIVGLELDQQVVRSSFKNLGTQPHFDKEKVHWWFGDAAKSLLMLPKEYYGSFDLVLVDLQTAVVEKLKVTNDLTIMDVAVLLMSPDGIIARNEDFVPRKGLDFADCTVDINYADVPLMCEQAITLGSNSIDFLSHKPINHDVDTLFFKRFQEGDDHFEMWYNYGKNATRTNILCKHPEDPEMYLVENSIDISPGVLMVLEAEDTEIALSSPTFVIALIRDSLSRAGLSITDEFSLGNSFIFILHEGYVFARTFPERRYCAFDIQLWSSFAKQSVVEKELVAAVGSKVSSSYRIVTGGMFSESLIQDNKQKSGPLVTRTCFDSRDFDATKMPSGDREIIGAVVTESIFLIQPSEAVVAVICGASSLSCVSLDAVRKAAGSKKTVAVWTCTGAIKPVNTSDSLMACEVETKQSFEDLVRRSGRISGIVLDPQVPRAMGQILHKLLSDAKFRRTIITDESYIVISPTPNPSEGWRRELLERFRTEFAVFDPSLRAQLFVNGTHTSMELGLFSAGDPKFYPHVAGLVSRINAITDLSADVRYIKNGVLNFLAEFETTMFPSLHDYDNTASFKQWKSQTPLGQQAIIHVDIQGEKPSKGDKILIEDDSLWYAGEIFKARSNGKFDVIYSKNGEKETGVKRDRIRFREGREALSVSTFMIRNALDVTLESLEVEEVRTYEDIGEGCVMAVWWSDGSAVLVWDGRAHFDVNLFTYLENEELVDNFEDSFANAFPFDLSLSHDIQPRGVGRVVNFKGEIGEQGENPYWVKS